LLLLEAQVHYEKGHAFELPDLEGTLSVLSQDPTEKYMGSLAALLKLHAPSFHEKQRPALLRILSTINLATGSMNTARAATEVSCLIDGIDSDMWWQAVKDEAEGAAKDCIAMPLECNQGEEDEDWTHRLKSEESTHRRYMLRSLYLTFEATDPSQAQAARIFTECVDTILAPALSSLSSPLSFQALSIICSAVKCCPALLTSDLARVLHQAIYFTQANTPEEEEQEDEDDEEERTAQQAPAQVLAVTTLLDWCTWSAAEGQPDKAEEYMVR
jgi:hypothetical protein